MSVKIIFVSVHIVAQPLSAMRINVQMQWTFQGGSGR